MFDDRQQDRDLLAAFLALRGSPLEAQLLEHFFYFPDETKANGAAAELREKGYTVSVEFRDEEIGWLALATKVLKPRSDDIGEIRPWLETLATRHDGRYDGWGMPFPG